MAGKLVLITGGTDGIGKQAAKELAAMGAEVVVVGRSLARCEAAVSEVVEISGNSAVDYLLADLSSMAEVASLAESFISKYDRLDVLMNNAGAGFAVRKETVDGFERTFALNHLAYFFTHPAVNGSFACNTQQPCGVNFFGQPSSRQTSL